MIYVRNLGPILVDLVQLLKSLLYRNLSNQLVIPMYNLDFEMSFRIPSIWTLPECIKLDFILQNDIYGGHMNYFDWHNPIGKDVVIHIALPYQSLDIVSLLSVEYMCIAILKGINVSLEFLTQFEFIHGDIWFCEQSVNAPMFAV